MNRHKQKGQAMVFGLLFVGIALIALVLMYNHGILTRDRVQVENAADAAVYSQAKLFARHQNLIAYTNRAIIANEMSVGQMVAMMSWSKRYANMPRWINSFPAYQIPVAPAPKPQLLDILNVVYSPYQILGAGIGAVTKPMISIYPEVVSSFNLVMGHFQKIFAIATLEAQFTTARDVVAKHQLPGQDDKLELADLSHLLLAQNFLMTYFADKLSLSNLTQQATSAAKLQAKGSTASSPINDHIADYLGGLTPSTMLINTAPEVYKKDGKKQETAVEARKAGREYAAIMNSNRNDWLNDRTFNLTAKQGLGLNINLGVVRISLGFELEAGSFSNGGTAYIFNTKQTSIDSKGGGIERYGWSSLDYTSLGFKLDVALVLEACIPVVGCLTLIDTKFGLGFGMPIGGGTHQMVAELGDALLLGPQWGSPTQSQSGQQPYGKTMQPVHSASWLWGNALGAYGINSAEDVSTGYAGAPSFLTLNENFVEKKTSHEFTVAVSKSLDRVATSDSAAGLNLTQGKFALDTRGDDGNGLASLWDDPKKSMMTVSSAETYFASRRNGERPSEYSPFWDARLREPSRIVQMIGAGRIDPRFLFGLDSGTDTSGILKAVLAMGFERLIDPSAQRVIGKLPGPMQGAGSAVLEKFVDIASDGAGKAINAAVGN